MLRVVPPRLIGGIALIVMFATACGSSGFPDNAFAIRASSDLGVGRERLLIRIGADDVESSRLGSPEEAVTLEVAPADDMSAVQSAAGVFTWIVDDVSGLYRAEFDFDRAGTWQATVVAADGSRLEPVFFTVLEEPLAPALGALAPLPPTPTLDDLPLEELTTDPEPDRRFYELSLQEAVASQRPTVLVFSTPAYCETAACGPLLDVVKAVAPAYDDVNFIHVEVFTGLTDLDFKPDSAHLAESVTDRWYRLPSEPWVFVIDRAGNIAGRFEGVMDRVELTAVLDMISL